MKASRLASIALSLALAAAAAAQPARYRPDWASLDSRPVPAWFDEAKFGIFIHWGVYSVPAWAPVEKGGEVKGAEPYAEWYWKKLEDRRGPTWEFHRRAYGEATKYQEFAPAFRAEMFDPDGWADLFARSGARYVVLTSKHHDGYALWPSAQSPGWNSADVGPRRDLAGDLAKSVRARGLKMGFYYSLYEWYHPLYAADLRRYVDEHMLPQMRDLVTRYRPSILWTDGEWEHPSADCRSAEFLAWLFHEAPGRDEIVVNDRWGQATRSRHGGFYTTEYGKVHLGQGQQLGPRRKWEECRGMGTSFGYNRNEGAEDYQTAGALVRLLVETVSRGGNLLLDIGPTADGRVPAIMQDRLLEIGRWLETNGEAIYGTRAWRVASDGDRVRYTSKGAAVYAVSLGWPGRRLALAAPKPSRATTIRLLGHGVPLRWRYAAGKLLIDVPALSVDEVPSRHAHVFRLTGVK